MSEFSSNYSRVNEKFNMLLNDHLVKAIRTHARLILIPFFQKVAITTTENESGETYPILTWLAERIINEVFQEGELGYESAEKAEKKALAFVKTLSDWQKECLAFYFCTDNDLLEKLEDERPSSYYEDTPEEDWDKETGLSITKSIHSMVSNEEWLASCIVSELIHLQDIFSTEDENCWDPSSITTANENFESYTDSNIKLIPVPIDDFDYWTKVIEPTENEDDDDDDEVDEIEEEEDDLGWVAREWIDYIKEYNKPLYLELTHNGTLEQAAREKQDKYFRKLDELMDSGKYTEEAAEEVARGYVYPKRKS